MNQISVGFLQGFTDGIRKLWEFFVSRKEALLELTVEHIWIVLLAVLIAIVLGIILGLLSSYYKTLASIILPFTQIMMTVPSLALLALFIPILGIGFKNGLTALVIYSLLPIVRNTYTGIAGINPRIIEAARGMGLTEWRILIKIKIPLAMPVILAGVRTATVMITGIAAIVYAIGAGGLGEFIFRGISGTYREMIMAGAIMTSILAIIADYGLKAVEQYLLQRQS